MRPIDPQKLHQSEELAREIGHLIGAAVKDRMRERWGFALLLFAFDGPELTWLSNANRDDMIKALEELIGHLKAGTADTLSRPRGEG